MPSSVERIQQSLDKLVKQGTQLYTQMLKLDPSEGSATSDRQIQENLIQTLTGPHPYHEWYSGALPVVKQLLPDRYDEFRQLYEVDRRRKEIDAFTYTISDFFGGLRFMRGDKEILDRRAVLLAKLGTQLAILHSACSRLDSVLSDIRGVLQAEMFDDELSAARELFKKGHLRAAGALAGVTVERHLVQVASNHGIKLKKSEPTIGDLNEALKAGDVLDVPNWRFVQHLSDLRNLCAHSKDREPTRSDVEELLSGAEKVIKTLF